MSVCRKLAAIVPATLMTLGVAMASPEIGLTSANAPSLQWNPSKKGEIKLKPVMEQAQDMHFSNTMLGEIKKIFPDVIGVRINEDQPNGEQIVEEKPPTRTIRTVQSKQVAIAVTDDDSAAPARKVKTRLPQLSATASKESGLAEPPRGATLFVEENRELEDRISREITAKLKGKGYDVQALTARMESLTAVKVIVLATLPALTEANAKEKLAEVRATVEADVLKGYPNLRLTKASSFGLASASGAKITEASAMSYELDRPDFTPSVRTKSVAVPEAAPAAAAKVDAAPKVEAPAKRKPRRLGVEAPERAPAAVTLQDKEKTEKSRQPTAVAAPAAKPAVKDGVKQKGRQETITPSESDFQD